MSEAARTPSDTFVRSLLVGLFALVVVRDAWIGDDAYITLRTVDNLVSGRGLVWNLGERVQVYTHPLWMGLVALLYAFSREGFYTLLVPSVGCAVAAVAVFARRLAPAGAMGWALLALFPLSRSFVDYSTSGLENPLTFLLLALSLVAWTTRAAGPGTVLRLSVLAGLAMCTRLDTALLHAPLVVAAVLQARREGSDWRPLGGRVAAGLAPLLLWEAFSLVYYGALVPNTALAKLNTGIPRTEHVAQGLLYLLDTLERDPLTALVLAVGVLAPLGLRTSRAGPVALGAALYLGWVVWIGGDFMAGRYLAAPFLAAVAVLARVPVAGPGPAAVLAAVALALGLAAEQPTVGPAGAVPEEAVVADDRGIADERLYYATRGNGLRSATRVRAMPSHPWRDGGEGLPPARIVVMSAAGMRGWAADPSLYAVDRMALGDPFLARLPAAYDPDWRVGHYERHLPDGYLESIARGGNHLEDPDLAALYDAVRAVVRAPLFQGARWRAIWRLNTGVYPVDGERYRYPDPLLADLGPPGRPADRSLERPNVQRMRDSGVLAPLGGERHDAWVHLWRAADLETRLVFSLRGEVVGETRLGPHRPKSPAIGDDYAEVPARARRKGFDAVRVLPVRGPEPWCFLAIDVTPKKAGSPSTALLLPAVTTDDAPRSSAPPGLPVERRCGRALPVADEE